MKAKILGAAAAGSIAVTACGGGGGTPTEMVTVTGNASFERVPFSTVAGTGLDYDNTFQAAIRGAVVEAIDGSTGTAILASGVTNERGDYALSVPANRQLFIRVKARVLHTGTPAWDFRVVDNTRDGALYALDSMPFDSGSETTRDVVAGSGWDGSAYSDARAAAPFAILDSVYVAMNKVLEADGDIVFPPLDINWSINNIPAPGDLSAGQITTSSYNGTAIYLLGSADNDTDEYDQHVVIHEWAHYLEDKFSRTDSMGGSHFLSAALDPRLAFSEGWSNAFSGIATGDSVYKDSFNSMQSLHFLFDLEANNGANPGWYNESSVQSILYDLYDSTDDGIDAVSLGFEPLFHVLAGAQKETDALTTIFSFITALKLGFPAQAAGIDAIVAGHDIVSIGMDEFGSSETNDAGSTDVLPVYTVLTPGGGPVQVCSISDFGTFNRLSNRRFLRFRVSAARVLTISATGAPGSDPDFVLFQNGVPLRRSESLADGLERLEPPASLAPGDYVLEVYEFGNLAMGPGAGRSCFEVVAD